MSSISHHGKHLYDEHLRLPSVWVFVYIKSTSVFKKKCILLVSSTHGTAGHRTSFTLWISHRSYLIHRVQKINERESCGVADFFFAKEMWLFTSTGPGLGIVRDSS